MGIWPTTATRPKPDTEEQNRYSTRSPVRLKSKPGLAVEASASRPQPPVVNQRRLHLGGLSKAQTRQPVNEKMTRRELLRQIGQTTMAAGLLPRGRSADNEPVFCGHQVALDGQGKIVPWSGPPTEGLQPISPAATGLHQDQRSRMPWAATTVLIPSATPEIWVWRITGCICIAATGPI